MAFWFWDASALAKRYATELGSDTADALFASVPRSSMSAATLGYAETFSILLRRPNGGQIGSNAFDTAVSTLQREVVNDPDFSLLHASEQAVFGSIALMRRHNLNSTDAILVALLLDYARTPGAETCVMIAADRRLLRASAAEGMRTVNPEELAAADVPALVASV